MTTRKRPALSSKWVFTLNLGSEESGINGIRYQHFVDLFSELGIECIFQLEKGESGNYHLQGWLNRPKRFRPIEMFKGSIMEGAHFERQRAQDFAAQGYCLKSDTRVAGPWANIDVSQKTAYQEWREAPEDLLKLEDFYGWQKDVWNRLALQPDNRTIFWLYDNGNTGKTTFIKRLCQEPGVVITGGAERDALFRIKAHFDETKYGPRIVIVNLSRAKGSTVSYSALESIKDGCVYSSKYEGMQIVWKCPHVIIFGNEPPDRRKMTADRWKVFEIVDRELCERVEEPEFHYSGFV